MQISTLKMLKETNQAVYKNLQSLILFHTNGIEGSTFTQKELTELIAEGYVSGYHAYDDVIETKNSIDLFNYIVDTLETPLSHFELRSMHQVLMKNTTLDEKYGFVGDYKKIKNQLTGVDLKLAEPHEVHSKIDALLSSYSGEKMSINDIADFHAEFEKIHPFADGNGRIGRMIVFKQCVENNLAYPIITNENAQEYRKSLAKAQIEGDPSFLYNIFEDAQKTFEKSSVNTFILEIENDFKNEEYEKELTL